MVVELVEEALDAEEEEEVELQRLPKLWMLMQKTRINVKILPFCKMLL